MSELLNELLSTRNGAIMVLALMVLLAPTIVLAALAVHWLRQIIASRAQPHTILERPTPTPDPDHAQGCVPRQEYNEMMSSIRKQQGIMSDAIHQAKERIARLEERLDDKKRR